MVEIKVNPMVMKDLNSLYELHCKESEKKAKEIMESITELIEGLGENPEIGGYLCKKLEFVTDCRYVIFLHHLIIYTVRQDFVKIYRILNLDNNIMETIFN